MRWTTELAFFSCCLVITQTYSGLAIAETTDSQNTSEGRGLTVSSISSNTSSRLYGNVEHSEHVQSVDPQLQPGSKANFDTLPKLIPGNNWVQIPAWYAGTWQFKNPTRTYGHLYVAGMPDRFDTMPRVIRENGERIRGHQHDRKGQIWHYCGTPYNVTAKFPKGELLTRVLSFYIAESNENQVVTKSFLQDIWINPKTLSVTKSDQEETFGRITPISDGVIRDSTSRRRFNTWGSPYEDDNEEMIMTRIKPFEIVNAKDGRDLKQLFSDFLRANNKEELIP